MSNETPELLSADQFSAVMTEHLRSANGITILHAEGANLHLRVRASELRFNLDQLYALYREHPEQIDAVAARMVAALNNYQDARSISDLDPLRERILPMLKPIKLLANLHERKLPMIAYRPFLADLIITYVISEPNSVAYITEAHLERWQESDQTIHDLAIANLVRLTAEHGSYTAAGESHQRMIVFNSQDGFDATRLLLPALLGQWRDQFPGNMVIGVPTRDFLIAFSDADQTVLANVARQIQFDASAEHGLTDQLFTLEDGQVREYIWE